MKYLDELAERLKIAKISLYKIALLIDEPKSTVFKIFKGKARYSDERINTILKKVESCLNDLQNFEDSELNSENIKIPTRADCPEIFDNYDLYVRLFELGLNARTFSPEEKLHFAIWHRTLTTYKKNIIPKT